MSNNMISTSKNQLGLHLSTSEGHEFNQIGTDWASRIQNVNLPSILKGGHNLSAA